MPYEDFCLLLAIKDSSNYSSRFYALNILKDACWCFLVSDSEAAGDFESLLRCWSKEKFASFNNWSALSSLPKRCAINFLDYESTLSLLLTSYWMLEWMSWFYSAGWFKFLDKLMSKCFWHVWLIWGAESEFNYSLTRFEDSALSLSLPTTAS